MPTTPTSQPVQPVPVGLIALVDLLERNTSRRMEIVDHEIAQRNTQLIALQEAHRRLSLHPLRALKHVLLYGINAFGIAWALGSVASLVRYYASLNTLASNLTINGLTRGLLGGGAPEPPSEMLSVLKDLPSLSLMDAAAVGLGVALLVVIERAVVAIMHGKKVRILREAEHVVQIELETLRIWAKR